MAYQYEAAKKAGVSDDEILVYLRQKNPQYRFDDALKSGLSVQDISEHLTRENTKQEAEAVGALPKQSEKKPTELPFSVNQEFKIPVGEAVDKYLGQSAPDAGTLKRLGRGALSGAAHFVEHAATPLNLGLMLASGGLSEAAPLASTAADLYFGGKGLYGAGKQLPSLYKAIQNKNPEEAAKIGTDILGNAAMATGGFVHGAKGVAKALDFSPQTRVNPDVVDQVWEEASQEAAKARQATSLNKRIGSSEYQKSKLEDQLNDVLSKSSPILEEQASPIKDESRRIASLRKRIQKAQQKSLTASMQLKKLPDLSEAAQQLESAGASHPEAVQQAVSDYLSQLPPELEAGSLAAKKAFITGKIREGQLRDQIFRNKLQEQGIDYHQAKGKVSKLGKTQNMSELLDKIEGETGIRAAHLSPQAFEALNQGEHVVQNARSIIDQIKKTNIPGERLGDLVEGKVAPANPQEELAARQARAVFDQLRERGVSLGYDIGYLKNYLPRRYEVNLGTGINQRIFKRLPEEARIKAEEQRTAASEKPQHIRDAYRLLDIYANEIGKAHILKQVPEASQVAMKLRALGKEGVAQKIEDWYGKMSGMKKEAGNRLFAGDFLENGQINMDKAIEAADLQKDKASEVKNALNDLMYHSYIGINPKTLIKHYLQPADVGAAEIGWKNVNEGRKTANKMTPADEAVWNQVKEKIVAPHGVEHVEGAPGQPKYTGKLAKGIEKLTTISKPGMKVFGKLDLRNRKIMFFGAYKQMLREGVTPDVLDGLLPGQKRQVLDAYQQGGLESAAQRYGLLRSHRTQYMYSLADRPLLLQNDLGDLLPFTTWGRNQWMRYLGDARNGDAKTIAKRLLYPLLTQTAFQIITGYKIPKAHPVSAALEAANANFLPAVTETAGKLATGNIGAALKQAGSILPPVRALQLGLKGIEKGPVEGVLGLQPSSYSPGIPQTLGALGYNYLKKKQDETKKFAQKSSRSSK